VPKKADIVGWKKDPVTKALFTYIEQQIELHEDNLKNAAFLASPRPIDSACQMYGYLEAMRSILSANLEDEEVEDEAS